MPETILDTQNLLFDATSPFEAAPDRFDVPSEFYDQGWLLLRELDGIDSAIRTASSILRSLDQAQLGWCEGLLPALKLAKADRLPCRDPDIGESFQALHFDMGLPLVERDQQVGYLFTMLYAPKDRRQGRADTRIVPVERVLRQRRFHSPSECDARLRDYADKYGDGWTEPTPYVTGRLGCFARVVDAMLEQPELTAFFDQGTWEWFKDGPASADGQEELAREAAWWSKHGYRLEKAEVRMQLRPGDLLLFDNVRCAHGRVGSRKPEEIWQVMWGVPHMKEADVSSARNFLASALAGV